MREASVSADDLAVAAAKGKLVELRERPGYDEAMHPKPDGSRTQQVVMAILAIVFGALTYVCWVYVDTTWLSTLLVAVIGGLGVFSLLATFGSAPLPAPTAWSAAVLGKSLEKRDGDDEPEARLTLLDGEGATHELETSKSIHEAVKTGDVGVAHVRFKELVGFVRL